MAKITAQRIGGTLAPYVDTDEIEAADIRVTNWLVVPDPDQPYDQWRIAGPDTGQRIRDPRRRADVFVDTYELVHGGTPDADGVPIADGDASKPAEQIWWTKKPLDLTHNDIDPEDALSGGYWYRIHVDVVTLRTENGTISGTLPAGRHHLPLEAVADWTPLYLLDAAGDVVRVNAAGQRDPAGDPVLDIDKLLEEPPTLTPLPSYRERVSDAVDATNPNFASQVRSAVAPPLYAIAGHSAAVDLGDIVDVHESMAAFRASVLPTSPGQLLRLAEGPTITHYYAAEALSGALVWVRRA